MGKFTDLSVIKNLFFVNLFFFFIVLSGISITYAVDQKFKIEPQPQNVIGQTVLGIDTEVVIVSTQVRMESIQFLVKPENRIPVSGNWDTIITKFELIPCSASNALFNYTDIPTNSSGIGTVIIPTEDVIDAASYKIKVKGYSHLTKEFGCYTIQNIVNFIDFTPQGKLLAGDTSVVSDDYVNALDLVNTASKIYMFDYKNDLNQDGKINSLDLSNIIKNYFQKGDI